MHRTSWDWVSQDSNMDGAGASETIHDPTFEKLLAINCLLGEKVNSCQRRCLWDALVNIPIPRCIQEALRALCGFKKWVAGVEREKWWSGGSARVWTEA